MMIEIIGTVMGVLGAILNCQPPGKFRRATFACWLPSNVILFAWSISIAAWWVAALYAIYICTSGWGLYNS